MDLNNDKALPRIEHVSSELVNIKGLAETNSSEVIRKKLEAELRAAEALGKVKQTIIEKRLAVELATIEDEYKKRKISSGENFVLVNSSSKQCRVGSS